MDGGVEAELAGPRLERVEDDHRPVDAVAEALQAGDQVERKSVGRPRGDADLRRQPCLAQRLHSVPNSLAGIADAVRVMEEEQVERGDPHPLQAALGRHPQIVRVLALAAKSWVGKAGESARAVALTLVEIVPDRADQGVIVARHAGKRPAQHPIRLTLPVGVGGEHGVDPSAGQQQRRQPTLVNLLAEVEEPPPAPGSNRRPAGIPHLAELSPTFSGSGVSGFFFAFLDGTIVNFSGRSSSSPEGSRSTSTVEPGVISPWRSTSSASGSSM